MAEFVGEFFVRKNEGISNTMVPCVRCGCVPDGWTWLPNYFRIECGCRPKNRVVIRAISYEKMIDLFNKRNYQGWFYITESLFTKGTPRLASSAIEAAEGYILSLRVSTKGNASGVLFVRKGETNEDNVSIDMSDPDVIKFSFYVNITWNVEEMDKKETSRSGGMADAGDLKSPDE